MNRGRPRTRGRASFLRLGVPALAGVAMAVILIVSLFSYLDRGQGRSAMFTDIATPEMAGADRLSEGACWGDFDGDRDEDLLVPSGREQIRLWRNDGAGSFTEVGVSAGIAAAVAVAGGCAFVDMDNDGDLDLYITERDPKNTEWLNKLFRNNGDGTFTDLTVRAGARMRRSGAASVDWADFDGDGDLDAFVAARWGRKKSRVNGFFEHVAPLLFREIGPAKGLADPMGPPNAFLGSWFDYDADGDVDLLLALDWWGVELYRNDRGTFTRVTTAVLPPATDSTPGAPPNNAMGATWGDFDNDGCIDVFITGINILGQGGFDARTLTDFASRLYRNTCAGTFADVTLAAGLRPTGLVEWGANFVDYDNDGDLDLSVVAGNASAEEHPSMLKRVITSLVALPRRFIPSRIAAWAYRYEAMIPASGTVGPAAAMPNFLYRNQLVESGQATFVEVTHTVGVGDIGTTRGSAWADMDGDGDLDWFIPNRRTPSRLFQNNGPVGHYLRVHLVGRLPRDAVGAWVRIVAGGSAQIRHVHVLDGYLSQSQMDPHFGLGEVSAVDELWVRWPQTTRWVLMCRSIPANRTVVVSEGSGCRW